MITGDYFRLELRLTPVKALLAHKNAALHLER